MKTIIEQFNSLSSPIEPTQAGNFIAFLASYTIVSEEEVAISRRSVEEWQEKWQEVLNTECQVGRAQLTNATRRANQFFAYCNQILACGRIIPAQVYPVDGGGPMFSGHRPHRSGEDDPSFGP